MISVMHVNHCCLKTLLQPVWYELSCYTPFWWKCLHVTVLYLLRNSSKWKIGPLLDIHKAWTLLLTSQLAYLCQYFNTTPGFNRVSLTSAANVEFIFNWKNFLCPFQCMLEQGRMWVHYVLAGGRKWRRENRSKNLKKLIKRWAGWPWFFWGRLWAGSRSSFNFAGQRRTSVTGVYIDLKNLLVAATYHNERAAF